MNEYLGFLGTLYMDPNSLVGTGPGFLDQVPTLGFWKDFRVAVGLCYIVTREIRTHDTGVQHCGFEVVGLKPA